MTSPTVDVQKLAETPGVLAVTMEEMRLALRADSGDEDLTIQRLIEAGQDYFEIRCAWRLTPASYYALVADWCVGAIEIPRGPLRQVSAVEYCDCDSDEWVMVTGDQWRTVDNGPGFFLIFDRDSTIRAPRLAGGQPGLRISFEAGFDGVENAETSAAGTAESGMVQCLKTLVALMYQKREEAADAEKDMILRRYRKFW